MITDQINVLNAAYAPWGWSFNLVVDRPDDERHLVHDDARLDGRDGRPRTRCARARRTTSTSTRATSGGGLLGWATFPSDYARRPEDGRRRHPLLVAARAARAAPYNLGDTATHEVGHWMGLYHTFQGGCNGNGDYVERHARREVRRVRLPGGPRHLHGQGPGVDPITNFMDYTDDACMDEFTAGQDARMDSQFTTYRFGK